MRRGRERLALSGAGHVSTFFAVNKLLRTCFRAATKQTHQRNLVNSVAWSLAVVFQRRRHVPGPARGGGRAIASG